MAYKTLFWFWVLYYFTKNTIGVVLRPRAAWEWIKERWHWAKLLAKFKMKIAIRYYRKVSR